MPTFWLLYDYLKNKYKRFFEIFTSLCNFVFERAHSKEAIILFQPSFLPNMVMNNMTNLKNGLSPLIECPCSDRITKSTVKTSSIITIGKCITGGTGTHYGYGAPITVYFG